MCVCRSGRGVRAVWLCAPRYVRAVCVGACVKRVSRERGVGVNTHTLITEEGISRPQMTEDASHSRSLRLLINDDGDGQTAARPRRCCGSSPKAMTCCSAAELLVASGGCWLFNYCFHNPYCGVLFRCRQEFTDDGLRVVGLAIRAQGSGLRA